MRLDEMTAKRSRTLSFEFFPPKNERAWHTLEDSIKQLSPFGPDFVSVTYGAGGSTRSKTREIVEHIQATTPMTAMAHLTCVGATKDEIRELLDEYHGKGIENILALRGDPPKEANGVFTPTPGGCANSRELLDLLREDGRFAMAAAAYPEGHPESPDRETDWGYLLGKFEAGASLGITQCFFDPTDYTDMMRWLDTRAGVRVLPGILPVVDYQAVVRFCKRCGANVPRRLADVMEPVAHDPAAGRHAGIQATIELCQDLLDAGAPGLHIYCLNRSTAAAEVVTALRLSGHLPVPEPVSPAAEG
jgi:methylenetetrahydrofolate reductase (NADPH)